MRNATRSRRRTAALAAGLALFPAVVVVGTAGVASAHVVCDAGWYYTVKSHSSVFVPWTNGTVFTVHNGTGSTETESFTYSKAVGVTMTGTFSTTAEEGVIFAEVKETVSASVAESTTQTVALTASVSTPNGHYAHAEPGSYGTYVTGTYYYQASNCAVTSSKTDTASIPVNSVALDSWQNTDGAR